MKHLLKLLFFTLLIGFSFAEDNNKVNRAECEFCDMIVYRIDKFIKKNISDEIPQMLTNLCFRTDIKHRSICETISEKYMKIIELLENNTHRNFVCDKLNLCNITNNENDEIGEDNLICEFIYFSLKHNFNLVKYIGNETFDVLVERTCKKLPRKFVPRCENMYVSYIEYFKESIENKKNSLETCLDIYYSMYFNKEVEEYIDYEKLRDL